MKAARQNSKIQRSPRVAFLLQDIFRIVFFLIIVAADLSMVLFLPKIEPFWLDAAGRVLAMIMTHLIVIMLLREIIPKMPQGSIRIGQDKNYLRWLLANGLTEICNGRLFSAPFKLFHFSRYIYLRAQGAKISYQASLPASVSIDVPSLLSIEQGTQIEAGVHFVHSRTDMGRIRVQEISISEGALVGAHSQLMGGASVGPNARIGAAVYIGPDVHVGLGVKIGDGAILAAGVDLGSYVRIGAGAMIAEGVSIAENAKVRAGSVIPQSTRIRAGEVWQGLPARAVYRDQRNPELEAPDAPQED